MSACIACGLPVLELRGQHAFLDSYLTSGDTPPANTAGGWHASCLASSSVGPAWYDAQIASYLGVRRFVRVVDTEGYTVVRNSGGSQDMIALGRTGVILGLDLRRSTVRATSGGAACSITRREYGLWLQPDVAKDVAAALRADGREPVIALAARLGISDRLVRPDLLADSAFRYEPELAPRWADDYIAVTAEYSVFVPDELLPYVAS